MAEVKRKIVRSRSASYGIFNALLNYRGRRLPPFSPVADVDSQTLVRFARRSNFARILREKSFTNCAGRAFALDREANE